MTHAVVNLIQSFVSIYTLLILATVLMSWVAAPTGWLGRLREFVDSVTGPYLRIFRRIVPPIGRFDLSPIVALFALQIAGGGVVAAATSL
jgi:YggT family protein